MGRPAYTEPQCLYKGALYLTYYYYYYHHHHHHRQYHQHNHCFVFICFAPPVAGYLTINSARK